MTTKVGTPRPDHIAELTRHAQLPLDPINDIHLSIILETISCAWEELKITCAMVLQTGDEAEVNALLDARLNNCCLSHPLFKGLVHSVQRGKETISFDGSKLEKRPDLSFVFLHGNGNFPLIIECKIIDHPNKKSVAKYCDNGIARFVGGDYAWANREAVMVAYVRDETTISSKLLPHLVTKGKLTSDPFQTITQPKPRIDLHHNAYQSEHQRHFSYLSASGGGLPGPISLHHLWL